MNPRRPSSAPVDDASPRPRRPLRLRRRLAPARRRALHQRIEPFIDPIDRRVPSSASSVVHRLVRSRASAVSSVIDSRRFVSPARTPANLCRDLFFRTAAPRRRRGRDDEDATTRDDDARRRRERNTIPRSCVHSFIVVVVDSSRRRRRRRRRRHRRHRAPTAQSIDSIDVTRTGWRRAGGRRRRGRRVRVGA